MQVQRTPGAVRQQRSWAPPRSTDNSNACRLDFCKSGSQSETRPQNKNCEAPAAQSLNFMPEAQVPEGVPVNPRVPKAWNTMVQVKSAGLPATTRELSSCAVDLVGLASAVESSDGANPDLQKTELGLQGLSYRSSAASEMPSEVRAFQ